MRSPTLLSALWFAALFLGPARPLPAAAAAPALLANFTAAATPAPATPASTTRFTRDQLVAALTRELAAHFKLEGELQLDLLRPWAAPANVATHWEVAVLEYPLVASSNMLVRCRLLADARPVADLPLLLRATLWCDAWTARQPLTAGAVFDPAALETRRIDLFRERDALPAAAGDRTYIFARAVAGGRLLTWRDISRRPLVRKGDLVEVAAIDRLLLVTLKGLALENGAQGEIISVRNPESQKNFSAVVIDENRVQVRF